ncbi:DNA topoisomerase IB [Salsipaludibacter albus]|uniref:DNA topoisomerase IB n=1 Tax=Salsipaludibacter albus TaxID=2849650 RepID=UPI001EE3CC7F|nr:DNA topoisomerase IB [Salsipaludibacter albus]
MSAGNRDDVTMEDPEVTARAAGLRHVDDDEPGITRVRRGTGFAYRGPDGEWLTDDATKTRMAELVVPPAWTDVWICTDPDGHVQATGRDDAGRKQHLYHPAWRVARNEAKYARLAAFPEALALVRDAVDSGLRQRSDPRLRVLALVVALLDETLVRIGNPESVTEHESFGLTTLRTDHVEATTASVSFDFVGKGGARHELSVADRRLARAVSACAERSDERLFTWEDDRGTRHVDSADVNGWLESVTDQPWSARDFRVWGGTVAAGRALADLEVAPDDDLDRLVLVGFDAAADRLNNTRDVARESYVHPAVPRAFHAGELPERFARARARTWLDRDESAIARLLADDA